MASANNPITTGHIYKDEGHIKAGIADLIALQAQQKESLEKMIERAIKYNEELKKMNVTTAAGRAGSAKAATDASKLAKAQRNLQTAYSDTGKKLETIRQLTNQQNKINRLTIKLNNAAEGSFDQLSAQYAINKIKLNEMSDAERLGTEAGIELTEQSRELYEQMKELDAQTGKNTLNVGNYASAVDALDDATGGAIGGVRALGNQFRKLLRNPIVLLIAAIVGGLKLLFDAFSRSEKGSEALAKATGAMNAVMSVLVKIAVKAVEAVERFAKDPIQGFKDLGSAIVENVLDRLKAIPLIAKAAFDGLKGILKFDSEAIQKAGEDMLSAVIQLQTGMDSEEQKEFGKAVAEVSEDIIKQTEAFIKLEAARRSVRKSNRELTKSVEQLSTEEQTLNNIVANTTKSFAEREEAAEKARKILEEKSNLEIQIARNNLKLINTEIGLRRKNGEDIESLLDQQLASYKELAAAERAFTGAVQDNERERAELKQDRLERDLDILIDGFDNQKTINEQIIADETRTFEEREALLEKTKQLSDDSFRKQIETIQQFTGIAIDANDLITESDAVALNEKIRSLGLSEIIEGRLLEIVRDRKSANQDLSKSEQELAASKTKALADEAKALEEANTKSRNLAFKKFENRQKLEKSEFDLIKRTAAEKERFELEAEKKKLQKILELNVKFNDGLSKVQIDTIKNLIQAIDNELNTPKAKEGFSSIYDLIFDDPKKAEAARMTVDFVKEQLSNILEARIEFAALAVAESEKEVSASEEALNREIANRNAGFANKVETAERELAAAKATQKKALEEQRKAQIAQQRIEGVQQAVSLLTASAKIWSQLGFPFAIPAIGLMFGSFIASRIQANKLAKAKFGKGGLIKVGGGSHASDNDTPLGVNVGGRPAYVEKDEEIAIIAANRARQYRDRLPEIIRSINAGTFDSFIQGQTKDAKIVPMYHNGGGADMKGSERLLKKLVDQNDNKTTYSDGYKITKRKNITRRTRIS